MRQVSMLCLVFCLGAVPAPGAAAKGPALSDLAWMAGSWASDSAGVREEEHWMAPIGGMMAGMHRDVRGGKARSFEFFRIAETDSGIFYLSQPQGRPVTPFALKELGARRVVFENAKHDYPQRVMYWLGDDGSLRARIEGTIRGGEHATEWKWPRSSLSP
jgi:hypothetical protein